MIRLPISPTGNPFRASPNSNICGTSCAGALPDDAHRDLFAKDPDRYTPQYDGYCAMGVSAGEAGHKDTVDPEAWAIVDGKLYLTHMPQAMETWRQNPAEYIKQADENWAAVKDLPEPVILGPPCAASPPSTLVALRDGGHWVVVGPEAARDESGNVVGKGDMGAQLEQVGKKVEACLKVAGASLSDIVETRTYVADPDQLAKYADLRKQYFGSASAGPDDRPKGRAFQPRQSRRGHGLRRSQIICLGGRVLGGPASEGGPASAKTGLFQPVQHVVARLLRAKLCCENAGDRRMAIDA